MNTRSPPNQRTGVTQANVEQWVDQQLAENTTAQLAQSEYDFHTAVFSTSCPEAEYVLNVPWLPAEVRAPMGLFNEWPARFIVLVLLMISGYQFSEIVQDNEEQQVAS
jgi:hypothetical protein